MVVNIENIKYPDFTGIEGYVINKKVPINKKLLNTMIFWSVKEDGMSVGCYLDENRELQIRTSEQPKISEDLRQRFIKLPCAKYIIKYLNEMLWKYPTVDIVLFGEFMLKGRSPKKVAKYEEDSFKAFDIYSSGSGNTPSFIDWKSFSCIMDEYNIPRVNLVKITMSKTLEDLLVVREELLKHCIENKWEGVVGKTIVTDEHGSFFNIVKEKPDLPKVRSDKDPKDQKPELPDSEITGAIEKVLGNLGIEKFSDVQVAMPIISAKVKEQCQKHGCRSSGRAYKLYRERLMRL